MVPPYMNTITTSLKMPVTIWTIFEFSIFPKEKRRDKEPKIKIPR